MSELEIIEIIRRIDAGATQPFQCRLEDGNLYAVKGRRATPKGLIAESVSALIGQEVGLPIPPIASCFARDDLLAQLGDPEAVYAFSNETCFASSWVEPAEEFSLSMTKKVEDQILATIYVFDHWIKNGDRTLTPHGGNVNLLLDLNADSLVAFDHNLAFSDTYSPRELQGHVGRPSWQRVCDLVGFRERLAETLVYAHSRL